MYIYTKKKDPKKAEKVETTKLAVKKYNKEI